MKRLVLLCLILAASTVDSLAQSTIQVISSFGANRGMPTECQQQVSVLHTLLDAYPHPADWSYFVVCDELAWQRVLTHLGVVGNALAHYGETALDVRMTFFRGPTLIHPDLAQASAEHVVTHELAHIALLSGDEARVERQAELWVKAHRLEIEKQKAVGEKPSVLADASPPPGFVPSR